MENMIGMIMVGVLGGLLVMTANLSAKRENTALRLSRIWRAKAIQKDLKIARLQADIETEKRKRQAEARASNDTIQRLNTVIEDLRNRMSQGSSRENGYVITWRKLALYFWKGRSRKSVYVNEFWEERVINLQADVVDLRELAEAREKDQVAFRNKMHRCEEVIEKTLDALKFWQNAVIMSVYPDKPTISEIISELRNVLIFPPVPRRYWSANPEHVRLSPEQRKEDVLNPTPAGLRRKQAEQLTDEAQYMVRRYQGEGADDSGG